MRKLYTIAREDFFKPDNGLLMDECQIYRAGSIWIEIAMTEAAFKSYKFPIVSA